MLTKNTIKTYLSNDEGRKMIELFTPSPTKWVEQVTEIIALNQADFAWISEVAVKMTPSSMISVDAAMEAAGIDAVGNADEFKAVMKKLVLSEWELDSNKDNCFIGYALHKEGDFRKIASYMPMISLGLWLMGGADSIYYPVLFSSNYSDFQAICNYAGIELPTTPPQKDKLGRCLLYYGVCESLDKFRKENELTKAEVCALIYGYLKSEINEIKGEAKSGEELPAPTRIWWAGASKEDYNTHLTYDSSIWQGNEECQRGDIIVIYARAPHSHIHSVWRAARDSKFEPFDYYCDRIEVIDRINVPHITINELKTDVRTKDWKVVRKQMQGMNQFEIDINQYNTLLEIFAEKGMDTSILPYLETPTFNDKPEIRLEKDVEEKLLIPLLSELGYSDVKGVDWERQYPIKLGHKVHGIPDFVFFPKTLETGGAHAPMLIEAKLDFKSVNQMRTDFNQGVSYVNPLGATYMGICDQNQIRIYKKPANGMWSMDLVPDFQATWAQLKNPEIFNKIKRLIGRDIIAKLKK